MTSELGGLCKRTDKNHSTQHGIAASGRTVQFCKFGNFNYFSASADTAGAVKAHQQLCRKRYAQCL
jgi:hypothetical protein